MNRSFDLEERLLDCAAEVVRFTEGMSRTQAGIASARKKSLAAGFRK